MNHYLLLFILFLVQFQSISQSLSKYIVIDQFGYRPSDTKIAVIRNPDIGYDAAEEFIPGSNYALVNAENDQPVFSGVPQIWNNGLTDESSGDKAWWFDFSSYVVEGSFYILDVDNNQKSFTFEIARDVYDEVLKHAVRTFYYQRMGYAKEAPYAETGWTDGASHIGPLQDKNCRYYEDKNNTSLEKDVSGGWYDAGDFNKYTVWTSNYVYEMLLAYEENPNAWSDDYNLPESGNGIPDLLDEAKWGMDHLLRMQNSDGSVIALVSVDHASPPSAADGQSLYGGVSSSATWAAAGAYAFGAKVFAKLGMSTYADQLNTAAINAYSWAEANPSVIWRNNDGASGTQGLGAGQQEMDDYGRLGYRLKACAHLYENTQDVKYKNYFESNYETIHLIPWYYAYPYETREQEMLLYYTKLDGISTTVKNTILNRYSTAITNNDHNIKAYDESLDPYRAKLSSYTWGSNNTKANHGNMCYDAVLYNTNSSRTEDLKTQAQDFIHYIHGINPLNICYLSNMYGKGAENCVNEFFHTWFIDGSAKWDRVGTSTYGPAPGFLAGGPNPSYDLDGCCYSGTCANLCDSEASVTPPLGQPEQKSYKDFNASWPMNSWSVTENSNGYQMAYIRLLSKFVNRNDVITGVFSTESEAKSSVINVYPNPFSNTIEILNCEKGSYFLYDVQGVLLEKGLVESKSSIGADIKAGVYILEVQTETGSSQHRIIKQ